MKNTHYGFQRSQNGNNNVMRGTARTPNLEGGKERKKLSKNKKGEEITLSWSHPE